MTFLVLFVAAVIWSLMKISSRRILVYLIVDVIVRSVEYVLFLSMGWMIGLWIIEKEEQLDLIPGWFDKDTSRSIDIDNTIPNNRSEYDLYDHEDEDQEEDPKEERIHMTASPQAFTRLQTSTKNVGAIDIESFWLGKKGRDGLDNQQHAQRQ
ncbi:MAG: hypothetical protein ACOVQS_00130 [Chitinophagaceae bacterium]|jgi:hypothetical protein